MCEESNELEIIKKVGNNKKQAPARSLSFFKYKSGRETFGFLAHG